MKKELDFDWLIIGSGFGGSVSALRLAEKGYRVGVFERGKRYADQDLPESTWQLRKFIWLPALGLKGIMKMSLFRDIFFPTQNAVGGGSTVYGGVLYRAKNAFFEDKQWQGLNDWKQILAPHYATAEYMLGANPVPFDSLNQQLSREMAKHFQTEDTFKITSAGVYFGEAGKTVKDPYFNGDGPDRTGCTRCGACMVGCRVGAVNSLLKNYLWFAEKKGVEILAEYEVIDVKPIGSADGSNGYWVKTKSPTKGIQTYATKGVIFAAGALGTNELLANCKHTGSLPNISDRLGQLVRTNSESVLNVRLPKDQKPWQDVTASSSFQLNADTTIEFLTYGPKADFMSLTTTVLVGGGSRVVRILKWLGNIIKNPLNWIKTLIPFGWSKRTIILLVMQTKDNAIAFRAKKRWFGRGYGLKTEQNRDKPNPTYIEIGKQAAEWLAHRTGGIAQSNALEVLANIPTTAHILGGAVIGKDEKSGVVNKNLQVFGYQNLMICDGSAMPANPGVNPALTITALVEHAMTNITNKQI